MRNLKRRKTKKTEIGRKTNVVQYSRKDGREEESEKESVLQTQRVHLFPFRTQKLSSAVVTILYGRLYGKIAQC